MTQTTTIITGNNAGATFHGAGSLRMARAAARGRKFVLKTTNTENVFTLKVVFTVWNADGVMVGSY
jgi:hypothetical protein